MEEDELQRRNEKWKEFRRFTIEKRTKLRKNETQLEKKKKKRNQM
jgi:hypothetical protein